MKNTILTIPARFGFADTLAAWVMAEYGADPLALPRVVMLLPSRRAAMSLRESFLRATGGVPLLLPRMQPVGEVSEDWLLATPLAVEALPDAPPSGFAFRRLFTLARLIRHYRETLAGHRTRFDHALRLAEDLGRLLDETERENVVLDGLATLVSEPFAAHWQVTTEFLKIISQYWPRIAEEEGLASPERYQRQKLQALAGEWKRTPPDYPVIAAGIASGTPALTGLLGAIAASAQGRIVLPGLDTESDAEYFSHIGETHPQWGMRRMLEALGVAREAVGIITGAGGVGRERVRLLAEIMRPFETTSAWQSLTIDMDEAMRGLTRVECANAHEESSAVALMLRQTLETPGKTAAFVTQDRALARRVTSLMRRWSVDIDDSAGIPLARMPATSFMRLIVQVAASDGAALPLLSLLKHPLAHAGMERAGWLETVRRLEMDALRGVCRAKTLAELMQEQPKEIQALLGAVIDALAPLRSLFVREGEVALGELLEAHITAATALAGEAIWQGREADALTAFLAELRDALGDPHEVPAELYGDIFDTLLAGRVYRPEYGAHPRLRILGPIEARMQSFDRVILGGLNEGSWPQAIEGDPWFNRPMRKALGLAAPEVHTGIAAHDFMMLAATPEVIITRAQKQDGAPATPSRWLVKLEALLEKYPVTQGKDPIHWNAIAAAIATPAHIAPLPHPAPKPPLAARPRRLSVTQIETWQRDPYALYAAQILKLRPLEAIAREPSGADFGNAAHQALEQFTRRYPDALPEHAYEALLDCGRQAFEPLFFHCPAEKIWWPRFARVAAWILEQEKLRRPALAHVFPEVKGRYEIGDFTLTGRADRLETGADGALAIIDYKTGTLPGSGDIAEGVSSQLALFALIAQEGELEGVMLARPIHPVALEYWQLLGNREGGKIKPVAGKETELYLEEAKAGLMRLIATYDNPDFPYLSAPIAARAPRYDDYAHLARVKEWR